jgi:lipoprotein NlpI
VLLDHQLEGGRLSGSSRAQALAERGISLDVLDDPYAARANFDEALRLLPDDAPLLGDAAANALMTGDFARSIELADRSLSLRPGDLPTQRTRAEAQYLSGDFAAAHATLATMLQDQAAVRSGYPIILLELARSRLSAAAGGASASYSDGDLPSEWPRPLVDHVLGRLDEDELIDHARSDRQNPSAAERLCEAYFYLGQRKLVEGDTQAAAKLFRKAMDQGITEYFEHAAARLELTRLDRR